MRFFGKPNITKWVPFTPTYTHTTGIASNVGFWRREMNILWLKGRLTFSGATDAGAIYLTIPFGFAIDSAVQPLGSLDPFGVGTFVDASGSQYIIYPSDVNATTIQFRYTDDAATGVVIIGSISQTAPVTIAASDYLCYTFQIPILGWS